MEKAVEHAIDQASASLEQAIQMLAEAMGAAEHAYAADETLAL